MKNQLELHIQSNLKDIRKALPEEIEQRMLKSSIELHGHVVRSLDGVGRSGKWYKVAGTKNKKHRASASGEPPATLYGGLRTGYKFIVEGSGYDAQGIVGNPEEYAVYLEKGTRKMSPRPHLRRAYVENFTHITRHFKDLIK
jgi:hypothetical protein